MSSASPLRNQFPSAVKVAVTVIDAVSGTPVSNTLMAGIEQFPRPKGDASANDPGPFGWGKPLEGVERILPNAGPDGLRFARIPASGDSPGFFLATTESTIGKVAERLKGYDPKAGRSDEFALEDPAQPAINLTPAKATGIPQGAERGRPVGRCLPAADRRGMATGREGRAVDRVLVGRRADLPEGANLLGPEPALAVDATAPSQPPDHLADLQGEPVRPGPYLRQRGRVGDRPHWRLRPDGRPFPDRAGLPLPVVKVEKADELGPDPFVGVRPAFELTPESGAALVRKRLASRPESERCERRLRPR